MSSQKTKLKNKKGTSSKDKESGSQRDVLSQGSYEDEDYAIQLNQSSQTSKLNLSNTDDIETPVATPNRVTKKKEIKTPEKKEKTKPKTAKPRRIEKKSTNDFMVPGVVEPRRKLQKQISGMTHSIPKGPFARLVREIIVDMGSVDIRLSRDCIAVLQEKTEQYMTNFFWVSNVLPKLRKTTTVQSKDIKLAKLIVEGNLNMNVHRNKVNSLFEELEESKPKPKEKKKSTKISKKK